MSMQRRAIAATRRGRKRAKALMIAECTIKRPAGHRYDPELGHEVQDFTHVYAGRCGFDMDDTQPEQVVLAGAEYTITNALVKLPFGPHPQKGDLLEITASKLDLPRPGTKAILEELADGTHRTAQRWRAVTQ